MSGGKWKALRAHSVSDTQQRRSGGQMLIGSPQDDWYRRRKQRIVYTQSLSVGRPTGGVMRNVIRIVLPHQNFVT